MRALIFDLDRTLGDTVSTHVIGWERASNELGSRSKVGQFITEPARVTVLSTRTLARESGRLLAPPEAESSACRQGEPFETFCETPRRAKRNA